MKTPNHPFPKWQIIDLVRSFSIFVVIWGHNNWLHKPMGNFWDTWLWKKMVENGPYGVAIFFTVSGFLITNVITHYRSGLFKPDFRKFYVQRAGRILPLYLLVVLTGTLIWIFSDPSNWKWGVFYNEGVGFDPWFWLAVATFCFNWLHFVHGHYVMYGAQWLLLWSLSVEEQFYFFYPLVLRKLATRKNLFRFLFFLIGLAFVWRLGCYFYKPQSVIFQNCNSFAVFDEIAFGALLSLVLKTYQKSIGKRPRYNTLICLAGFFVIAWVFAATSNENTFDRIYTPTLLGGGLFLFLLGGLNLSFFNSTHLKAFSLPGKYCYGMYLIHPNIICFTHLFFLIRMNEYGALLAIFILCTVVAGISYHFFEMPANRFVRKKLGEST